MVGGKRVALRNENNAPHTRIGIQLWLSSTFQWFPGSDELLIKNIVGLSAEHSVARVRLKDPEKFKQIFPDGGYVCRGLRLDWFILKRLMSKHLIGFPVFEKDPKYSGALQSTREMEVAEIFGCPVETVAGTLGLEKQRVFRIMNLIQEQTATLTSSVLRDTQWVNWMSYIVQSFWSNKGSYTDLLLSIEELGAAKGRSIDQLLEKEQKSCGSAILQDLLQFVKYSGKCEDACARVIHRLLDAMEVADRGKTEEQASLPKRGRPRKHKLGAKQNRGISSPRAPKAKNVSPNHLMDCYVRPSKDGDGLKMVICRRPSP